MKRPIRLLRDGEVAFINRDAVVADKNNDLYVNRETLCYDDRNDSSIMVQRFGTSISVDQTDINIAEPRPVSQEELRTAQYIVILERKPFLSRGFDPN